MLDGWGHLRVLCPLARIGICFYDAVLQYTTLHVAFPPKITLKGQSHKDCPYQKLIINLTVLALTEHIIIKCYDCFLN